MSAAGTRARPRGVRGQKRGGRLRPLLIGAHCSTSGGPHKAFATAEAMGAETMQIFTRNNMTWNVKPLTADAVAKWRDAAAASDVAPVIAHDSYLINLASPDATIFGKSCLAFADELARCAALEIPYLVMHPGAPKERGPEWGVERIAGALQTLLDQHDGAHPMVLLETTAGQGSNLGYTFEQIAALLQAVDRPARTGVCVDTCHLFAAGYDIRTPRGWATTMAALDEAVGIDRVHCIHVNDALRPLGSRVDRHEHLGRGHIGLGAFRALMRDSRFRGVPKILELPGTDTEGEDMNLVNLKTLRHCAGRTEGGCTAGAEQDAGMGGNTEGGCTVGAEQDAGMGGNTEGGCTVGAEQDVPRRTRDYKVQP